MAPLQGIASNTSPMTNKSRPIACARKTVVLNAIHPAPYIDTWIDAIQERYEVEPVYNYATSAAKTWSNYHGEPGKVTSHVSFAELFSTYAKADLVIFSGWFEQSNLMAMIALRLIRNKVVVFSDYPKESRKSHLNVLLKKFFIDLFVDAIFCATRSTMDWYAENLGVPREKLHLFPYGMSGLATDPSASALMSNARYKGGVDIFRVFVANNFRAIKGYATLLDSLRRLKKDGILDMFSFAIAGTGEEFETYRREFTALGGNIVLLGWIEISEYESYLKSANIFVHASDFEPFGIPPLDAISVGTPVVVSSGVQSLSGIIENGRTGYVFKQGSGQALAETLKLASAERERLPQMARMAQALLKREFGSAQWLVAIDRTLDTPPGVFNGQALK